MLDWQVVTEDPSYYVAYDLVRRAFATLRRREREQVARALASHDPASDAGTDGTD